MTLVNNQMIWRTLAMLAVFVCSKAAQTLRKVAIVELPSPKGESFDYLTIDDEDYWLLSAHLGPGILYVIDVRTNKLVKAVPGVSGITGLEYVPGLRKVYTSDWGEEKIGIVDLQSMKVVKSCDGRLVQNVIMGRDDAVQSARQLGADRRISMWQAKSQVGLVVLQPPPIPRIDHEVPLVRSKYADLEEEEKTPADPRQSSRR